MKYRIVEDTHSLTPWFRLEHYDEPLSRWALIISGGKVHVDRVAADLKGAKPQFQVIEEFDA